MTMNPVHAQNGSVKAGIDDLSIYVPRIYLPMEALADSRGYEFAKLRDGLGLHAMAFPDAHEDSATMAANAVLELMEQNQLDPTQIGRIYVGTESALDGSKPTATYVLDMLTQYYSRQYGPDCFLHCDVVDLTFACIGAVDALQNTLDWVRAKPGRIGIVVSSDVAKYELGSGGEYTQGAGAIALLIRQDPRLLAIDGNWGVATRSVHDFFKPVRTFHKEQIVAEVLKLAGLDHISPEKILAQLSDNLSVEGFLDSNETEVQVHKETPMFDGPYSNSCYQERIREALSDFVRSNGLPADTPVTNRWKRLAFHLPYAFQARRMFSEVFFEEAVKSGTWADIQAEVAFAQPKPGDFNSDEAYQNAYSEFLRAITKTRSYRQYVQDKIEKSERASSLIGNMYTSSIFLALVSIIESDLRDGVELGGARIGFFGYGSGSKSKVFEGEVQPAWREVAEGWRLMDRLKERQAIPYATYEALHRKQLKQSVGDISGEFYLDAVNQEPGNYTGARTYRWKYERTPKLVPHV